MNNMEEQLWDYIDGRCTPDEQEAVSALIASDEFARLKYNQLLNISQQLSTMELDEPPMAFTYNVMEAIRTEEARKPLKAAINKRIITSIAAFFMLTIFVLLVYVIAGIHWSSVNISSQMPAVPKMLDAGSFITRPVIMGFLFFDVVLGLFLFDTYLRRKRTSKQL
jgi:anti-sigma factor RsiW